MRAVVWEDGSVRFLDQTQLPEREVWITTDDPSVLVGAMQCLAIRGAPLIGIAAAYGAVLAVHRLRDPLTDATIASLRRSLDAIAECRPTAVNLHAAIERMRMVLAYQTFGSRGELADAFLAEARAITHEDEAACEAIARHGSPLVLPGSTLLTHCNTGSLATGGRGTALGVITRAWEQGTVRHVYVCETRPLFQGSRLTAWELDRAGVPATIITDSTTAVLFQQKKINAVFVGADRIARNGDVANKIGTLGLALLARMHGIPFFVAAPMSSVDVGTQRGEDIPIEERSGDEIMVINGKRIAPSGSHAYAPAFDVTPADYVTAIITELGVCRPPLAPALSSMQKKVLQKAGTGTMA